MATETPKAEPFRPAQSCPLDGLRVLDFSRLVAGNMLTLQLADFGAEVIKLEPDMGDPLRHWRENGVSAYWKVYGRNKKSVRLDLRSDEGKALLARLIPTAHVLVESFRPGSMEAAGFGPDAVAGLNPKLVFVRISGFGQTGPYAQRPGFGSLVEAMSGFASKNGFADKPPALPNFALADMVAGIQGAFAVMVAVRAAERPEGKGQVVDLSLLEPLHSTLGPEAAAWRITGSIPPRSGNRASITAPRNIYATADGGWVALSASTQAMTERLFRAIGRADMLDDPRFRTNSDRLAHVDEVDAVVGAFIGAKTLAENLGFFGAAEVTVGPVYDASGFETDPHVRGRGVLVEMEDAELGSVPMHAVVPRLSGTPGALRRPAPDLGADETEILGPLRAG
ncbi:MAG TPA: CoA transferase [Aliidongia sp.]|uniref:CaiB/BaiF CoA transferase family protein n=1 Tax=Aliidongia sp. TaxID=1914230 RepID=UPI002DDD4618|nr:CoA transferase [Aliidongia sp.]HEV2676400.1 CoA transferase [Aliidongia sp.]